MCPWPNFHQDLLGPSLGLHPNPTESDFSKILLSQATENSTLTRFPALIVGKIPHPL